MLDHLLASLFPFPCPTPMSARRKQKQFITFFPHHPPGGKKPQKNLFPLIIQQNGKQNIYHAIYQHAKRKGNGEKKANEFFCFKKGQKNTFPWAQSPNYFLQKRPQHPNQIPALFAQRLGFQDRALLSWVE